MEDETLLRTEYKTTIGRRGLGHVTQFRHFGIIVTFERIELSASNSVYE